MQATQSRTASELVERSVEFAAFRRVKDGTAGVAEGAGLAHDAGNLLGALSLYSELLAMPGVLHEEHRAFAAELRLLSDRSWAMIHRLVNHARAEQQIGETGTVLPEAIERCRGLLNRIAGQCIDVSYGVGAYEPVPVRAEAVERILTNLVKNAAEATPGAGQITVAVQGASHQSRPRVILSVRDQGCGMTAAAVGRLLRAGGISSESGRGLGFRVVRELVAISGGCLSVESRPGAGTSISIEWDALDTALVCRGDDLSRVPGGMAC